MKLKVHATQRHHHERTVHARRLAISQVRFLYGLPSYIRIIRRNKYKVISRFVLNTVDQIYVHTLSISNKEEYLALEISAY